MDIRISRARTLPLDGTEPTLIDVHIKDGLIERVTPALPSPADGAIDADGAVLLPGLWDAHVHLAHQAMINEAIDVSHTVGPDDVVRVLRREIPNRPDDELVLGFGFHAATWGDPPTSDLLDEVTDRPLALISGDAHSFWANRAGLALAGVADHPTGFIVEQPAFEAQSTLMDAAAAHLDRSVARLERHLAALGLVGIVDMHMGWGIGDWLRRTSAGDPLVRVEVATYPGWLDRLLDSGHRTGDLLTPQVTVGPLKVIADGSLHSRTALCRHPYPTPLPGLPNGKSNHDAAELTELLRRATDNRLAVAIHAIGDLAVSQALDAFEASGARGTIEHAQFVTPDDVARLARLGVVASIQPAHLLEDAEVLDQVWPGAGADAFPWRSLLDAGARITLGSDAPTSPLNPWVAMDAAVNRTHHAEQRLTPTEAIAASVRSCIAPGQPADLLLVDASPETLLAGQFLRTQSLTTIVAGRITHRSA